jgi:dienelactone hydrolase
MSQDTQQDHISKKVVVYRIPGMEAVKVQRDVAYRATRAGALTMDIYYPPDSKSGARIPAVLFVAGYPDVGYQKILGCKFKEMGSSISWGRLTAASGLVAITYTNREPAADLHALLEYIRQHAADLGIDENRIGVWACSGNVPLALSVLMQEGSVYLKCAVLCYGLMLDLEGSTIVAEAARTWGFANPCAGKSVADLPQNLPLFIARAGQDQMPHLNETIDRFLAAAVARNLSLTFTNHQAAPHAFDLFDDSETTREIIRQILAFMRFHLLAVPAGSRSDSVC